jgi:hypothetical protein
MVPVLTLKSNVSQIDDGASVNIRVAKEQEFYDQFGADSIVRFFRFIQSVDTILNAPAILFDGLFGRLRQRHVTISLSKREQFTRGLHDG